MVTRRTDVRLKMLEEAIQVIQVLWKGGVQSFHGSHYDVADTQLYTRPTQPPSLMVAASNPGAAELAGRVADTMINTEVKGELVRTFRKTGGKNKPRFVEITREKDSPRTLGVWPRCRACCSPSFQPPLSLSAPWNDPELGVISLMGW